MNPTPRRALLVVHIVTSLGWIGAVGAFLALNIVGLTTENTALARAMFVAMDVVGLYAIVPLSLASLLTGVMQGLWTPWGLIRYRWVLTKLVLGKLATMALLLHQFTAVRDAARRASMGIEVGGVGTQLVLDASAAIVVLLLATILSVFKPWGLTRYGQRKKDDAATPIGLSRSAKIMLAVVAMLLAAFAALHLAGAGMRHGGSESHESGEPANHDRHSPDMHR
jgi:hypothetical protein